MRTGVRLALDLGKARVGVARCDQTASLASPHAVWHLETESALISELQSAVSALEPIEILIGLPVDLRGKEAVAASEVRTRAAGLAAAFPGLAFRLVDERLSTAAARKLLQAAGYNSKADKALIDAAAATVILEDALEAERRQGRAPGELIG